MARQAVIVSLFMLCSSLLSINALASGNPVIEIGTISSNGSGCPQGTVTHSKISNTTAAILFSVYRSITHPTSPVDVVGCNLAIPIKVQPGFTVGIADFDWRGTVFADDDSAINFHREYFFSGHKGVSADTYWDSSDGKIFENFFRRDTPGFIHYSGCDGAALIARVDSSALVMGPSGLFSLRSADINAKLLLNFRVKPC